jgi:O-methyltransferase involved in polyketide biosynthesis
MICGKSAHMTDEIRPVALTAQFTAKARSIESQRTNALFHDPWADLFADRAGDAWLAPLQWDAQVTTPEEVGRRLACRMRSS